VVTTLFFAIGFSMGFFLKIPFQTLAQNPSIMKHFPLSVILVLCLCFASTAQVNPDTVRAGRYDNGKMWTFDFPPLDYFEKAYGFRPTQQWMDETRMSALRFANYCSASFVSADGLVMTNHHCARES